MKFVKILSFAIVLVLIVAAFVVPASADIVVNGVTFPDYYRAIPARGTIEFDDQSYSLDGYTRLNFGFSNVNKTPPSGTNQVSLLADTYTNIGDIWARDYNDGTVYMVTDLILVYSSNNVHLEMQKRSSYNGTSSMTNVSGYEIYFKDYPVNVAEGTEWLWNTFTLYPSYVGDLAEELTPVDLKLDAYNYHGHGTYYPSGCHAISFFGRSGIDFSALNLTSSDRIELFNAETYGDYILAVHSNVTYTPYDVVSRVVLRYDRIVLYDYEGSELSPVSSQWDTVLVIPNTIDITSGANAQYWEHIDYVTYSYSGSYTQGLHVYEGANINVDGLGYVNINGYYYITNLYCPIWFDETSDKVLFNFTNNNNFVHYDGQTVVLKNFGKYVVSPGDVGYYINYGLPDQMKLDLPVNEDGYSETRATDVFFYIEDLSSLWNEYPLKGSQYDVQLYDSTPDNPDNPDDPDNPDNPDDPDNPEIPDIPDIPHITVPYGSAVQWFEEMMDARSKNYAFGLLMSLYNGYGDSRFFDVPILVSGITDIRYSPTYSANVPLWISVIPDGEYASSQIHGTIDVDAFSYGIYTNYGMPTYYDYYQKGTIEVSIYFETGQNARTTVKFYPDTANTYTVMLEYNGTFSQDSVSVTLDSIYTSAATYTPEQLSKLDFAFTLTEGTTPNLLSVLCELLFVRDICTFDDVVYSPRDFYYSLDLVYNLGYEDGYRISYPIARDEGYKEGYRVGETNGYDRGYDVGYDAGYDVGYAEHPDYNKGYDDGYHKAVSEIDSGEYGRNLLGGLFSAPFEAVGDIVLMEWTTASGQIITISLMSVFTAILGVLLFIWFLKLFAGG